jgi:signal transduction histidine kinase
MAAQILARHPERLYERREFAVRIERNIERTDRMIRDLLDANRIRAGERLPLRIDECDLVAVAREVYDELVATFGERFSLLASGRLLGFWSHDELRRALWNLATNATKYGAEDKPIAIAVERTDQGARAIVHNWGTPIAADDQQGVFKPFSRTSAAKMGGQKGWGLGLTFVHGCALAHGRRVRVESAQDSGTSFIIDLPLDSRPFQVEREESTPAQAPTLDTLH